MEFLPVEIYGQRVYAGFWPRLFSNVLDGCILLPLGFLLLWADSLGKTAAMLSLLPSAALYALYSIYFNATRGGTPGKLILGIRITRPDGSPIGWRAAGLRSCVDLGFALLMAGMEGWALAHIANAAFDAGTELERLRLLQAHYPAGHALVNSLQWAWILSEVVVLLFNRRRRAIHDYIAGTVVVHKEFLGRPVPASAHVIW